MKTVIRVSFKLEMEADSVHSAVHEASRRVKTLADSALRSDIHLDGLEIRGTEIKKADEPGDERER